MAVRNCQNDLQLLKLLLEDPPLGEGEGDALADAAACPAVRHLGQGAQVEVGVEDVATGLQDQLLAVRQSLMTNVYISISSMSIKSSKNFSQ